MPRKPTKPFGAIVFPKHGPVRKTTHVLSDRKECQELEAISRFIALYNQYISTDFADVQALPETDHDFKAQFRYNLLELQLTELSDREFLFPTTNPDGSPNPAARLPFVFTAHGQYWKDEEACKQALWNVISKKLDKNYATSITPVWLVVFSTSPYNTEYFANGELKVSEGLALARKNLNGRSISPFSEIWFTDLMGRPIRVYAEE